MSDGSHSESETQRRTLSDGAVMYETRTFLSVLLLVKSDWLCIHWESVFSYSVRTDEVCLYQENEATYDYTAEPGRAGPSGSRSRKVKVYCTASNILNMLHQSEDLLCLFCCRSLESLSARLCFHIILIHQRGTTFDPHQSLWSVSHWRSVESEMSRSCLRVMYY